MTNPNRSGQNTSSAVMQQRADPRDALDYFPTPPWATRALCEWLAKHLAEPLEIQRVWEPACGELHMARPLREYFASVHATDVVRYTPDHGICDFLLDGPSHGEFDWIITNPPFGIGDWFVQKAIERARRGVAMFVRSSFAEGEKRYEGLFTDEDRPAYELVFCERVVCLKGRLIQAGRPDPFNLDDDGDPRKASTATSYVWLIWLPGQHDTRKRWLKPGTRRSLEREGDYPDYSNRFPEPKGSLL